MGEMVGISAKMLLDFELEEVVASLSLVFPSPDILALADCGLSGLTLVASYEPVITGKGLLLSKVEDISKSLACTFYSE